MLLKSWGFIIDEEEREEVIEGDNPFIID